jgi:hypothetical protein
VKGSGGQTATADAAAAERGTAVAALLGGALIWGLIWYPSRVLRDGGVDGIVASTASDALAFALGWLFWRPRWQRGGASWTLLWLALAAAACNLGYVLATPDGEVMRVLLLANLVVQFGLARVAANRAIVIMLGELAVAAVGGAGRQRRSPSQLTLAPQQRLYLRPLPQGQGSLRPTFGPCRRIVPAPRCARQKR